MLPARTLISATGVGAPDADSTQCAAVRTQREAINVPPQNWLSKKEPVRASLVLFNKATVAGADWMSKSVPPTIRRCSEGIASLSAGAEQVSDEQSAMNSALSECFI